MPSFIERLAMIYLLRHGQTEFNREGRYQGALDSPLTDLGRAQAAGMGARLKALIGDPAGWLLQSSPLGRARATAEIVRAALGVHDIVIEPRLREITLGAWDGLTGVDIDEQYPGARDGAGRYGWLFRAPGGESFEALTARLKHWLDDARVDRRPRVVVSHGITGRALCALVLGTTMEGARLGATPQDSIFRITASAVEAV
jgi:probable phosphoglycerate mutase